LERRHSIIIYEVVLRIDDLVRNAGDTIQPVTWDLIFQILKNAITYSLQNCCSDCDHTRQKKIFQTVNEILDATEKLIDAKGFTGPMDKFFDVVDVSLPIRTVRTGSTI